jgi:nucleoside triphosphate diphosphatase
MTPSIQAGARVSVDMVAERCEKMGFEQAGAANVRCPARAAAPRGGSPAPPFLPAGVLPLSESHPAPESDPGPTPADIAEAGPFPAVDGVLDRTLALVRYLRDHCPWDRKQTARSLVPHLLEETHEAVDAIRAGDHGALRGELGDLLLNLAFQIVVAEEEGRFDREAVVRGLEEKMIRRHPHLFGLGEKEPWEAIKARERADAAPPGHPPAPGRPPSGILEGLATGLDPLLRAHRMQEKVSGVGFDWDEPAGALDKVKEEVGEVERAMAEGNPARVEEEMGDLLFSVVNLARLAEVHAVPALEAANAKFRRRFERIEALARERGVLMPGATLEELDRLWDEVKAGEREEGRGG